jgi:hypothetical protein
MSADRFTSVIMATANLRSIGSGNETTLRDTSNRLRNRAFSVSRSFRRLTWSDFRPPYSLRQGSTSLPLPRSNGSPP